MATKLPAKDVVVIGLGWAGSIVANELTDAGLNVVAIERGPWRDTATDFNINYIQDELRYVQRFDLMLRPEQETLTVRNNASQAALPVRQWGSFRPGTGVGGAGVHWTGISWRFDTNYFRLRSHYTERYGAKAIPDYMTIADLPLTYDELEPFYDRYEYLAGISGKAGNLKGQTQAGGNPFEAPRAGLSMSTTRHALCRCGFRRGRPVARFSPVSGTLGQRFARLYQPDRRHHGTVHVLRVVLLFWLCQLLQEQCPDDRASGADAQSEF
jgi:choline dehydrogenase-like flavoprotein